MKTVSNYLQTIRPGRGWLLTAISNEGNLETKMFTDNDRCEAWIALNNGMNNLYYHVNPTPDAFKPVAGGRAKEVDIEAVDYLHVDIDPNPRPDLKKGVLAGNKQAIAEMQMHNEAEKERIYALLTTNRPSMVPPPTWIIFSGGGYQALWKLIKPFVTMGDADKIKEAKLKNQQLELLFGADSCHNLDRLLRLPFTWNMPNQRKQEKCREKAQAAVVKHNAVSYDFEDFTAAIDKIDATVSYGKPIEISGNIEPVMTADVLDPYFQAVGFEPWRLDAVKVIMALGHNPEKTKPDDNSRNTWLLHFCCECVRAGVPNETIYSVITDKEWGISESVVERKSANAVRKYAMRQIRRAHEFAVDPKLEELNAKHCVIADIGGKLRILREYFDDTLKRHAMSLQPQADFMAGYNNKSIEFTDAKGNPKLVALGKWWMGHSERRQYERMAFAPDGAPPEVYNLWHGFDAEDIPGDCDLFIDHIRTNICDDKEDLYEYLMNWLACMVQKPAQPGHTAIVLHGNKGVGKGFFVKRVGELVGRHFLQVTNAQHLTGNFNGHLADTLMLFADEAFYANDKKHESVLKGIVTEETLAIERKGIDLQTTPNYLHIIMASNSDHVVPASVDERRFVVYDVASAKMQDTDYFAKIAEQWENGGKDAFFSLLRHRDIKSFHPGKNVPNSEGLGRQKNMSLPSVEEWWFEKLQQGYLRDTDNGWTGQYPVPTAYKDYKTWCGTVMKRPETMNQFSRTLKRMVPGWKHRKISVEIFNELGASKVPTIHWVFDDIKLLRSEWDARMNTVNDWSE